MEKYSIFQRAKKLMVEKVLGAVKKGLDYIEEWIEDEVRRDAKVRLRKIIGDYSYDDEDLDTWLDKVLNLRKWAGFRRIWRKVKFLDLGEAEALKELFNAFSDRYDITRIYVNEKGKIMALYREKMKFGAKLERMKLGRLILREVKRMLPNLPDRILNRIVNGYLARMLDTVREGFLVISNDIADILFPNYGSFDSCFSKGHEYFSSVNALAHTPNVLIAYFTHGRPEEFASCFIPRRIYRSWVIVDKCEDILNNVNMVSVVNFYPTVNDNEGEAIARIIGEMLLGIPEDNIKYMASGFLSLNEEERVANNTGLIYYDGVKYPTMVKDIDSAYNISIDIEYPVCPTCGITFGYKYSEFCCCDCTGKELEEYPDDDYALAYCERCGEPIYDGDEYYHLHDGGCVCSYCYDNYAFYCERCEGVFLEYQTDRHIVDEYIINPDAVGIIEGIVDGDIEGITADNLMNMFKVIHTDITVCEGCLDDIELHKCEVCGNYYTIISENIKNADGTTNLVYVHTVETDRYSDGKEYYVYICPECLKDRLNNGDTDTFVPISISRPSNYVYVDVYLHIDEIDEKI